MARECKTRKSNSAIAIIVDGQDEKWYVNKVKEKYPCDALKSIKVKPELPQKKKVQKLFDFAKNKLKEGYTYVILIFDMEEPLKNVEEYNKFKELYDKYLCARDNKLKGGQKSKYGWMNDLLLIVNNPCLEYWYLLHYHKTTKYYADYASLSSDLRKIPELAQYDKTKTYYNDPPDIYERLSNGLNNARNNSIEFDLNNCKNQGSSGMNLMFDYFDRL